MRRAISTASRPSPGAEKSTTDSSDSPAGGVLVGKQDSLQTRPARVHRVRRGASGASGANARVPRVSAHRRMEWSRSPIAAAAITACANSASAFERDRDVEHHDGLVGEQLTGSRAVPPWPSPAWSRNRPRRLSRARQWRARAARRDRVRRVPGQPLPVRGRPSAARASVRLKRAREARHVGDRREVFERSFFLSRSSATRAATASSLSGALGVRPRFASAGKASRAASSVKLDRETPNVAPRSAARTSANSSAAARLAPITRIGGSSASTTPARAGQAIGAGRGDDGCNRLQKEPASF